MFFDRFAEIETENQAFALWLDRLIFVFLFLTFLSAPHSIAATQISWLSGFLLAFIRYFISPRPQIGAFPPLAVWLWALLAWSALSAVFSYAPDISLDKLKAVSLFVLLLFVFWNVKTAKRAKILLVALLGSCMVNVLWMPIERVIGRGVEVAGIVGNDSGSIPEQNLRLRNGDTILEVNGKKVRSPEAILSELQQTENFAMSPNGTKIYKAKLKLYRPDYYREIEVPFDKTASFQDGSDALGFTSWKPSRNWRSAGFYGHYTTYAEVLQLISALFVGLLIAFFKARSYSEVQSPKSEVQSPLRADEQRTTDNGRRAGILILLLCLALSVFALLLTVTRASQLSFLISSFVIVVSGAGRKILFLLAAISLPLAIGGLLFLQSSRQVGFFDQNDDSITWRQTVYREGINLMMNSPKNLLLGVGMDSIKRHWREWGMFDGGKIPTGHFHNTYLQLAVERGIPALLLWLLFLFAYLKTLRRGLQNDLIKKDRLKYGILLGAFGGTIGFMTSGLAHYNLGDSEVVMTFYMIAGIAVFFTQDAEKACRSEV